MKKLNSEKGFALPVALMLLVVMTLMGAALVTTTSSDMSSNNDRDNSSQAFYAAESGISMAKEWLAQQHLMFLDLIQIINFDFVKQVCFQVSDQVRREQLEIKEDRIIFIEII